MRSEVIGAAAWLSLCSLAVAHSYDLTQLPLDDGQYTLTTPQKNYVYSCTAPTGTGGGTTSAPWIGTTTWNFDTKVTVSGSVSWPNASFSDIASGSSWLVNGNGLPSNPSGIFPIQSGTTAFTYDQNPNSIVTQSIALTLPLPASVATKPYCTNLGMIGMTFDGAELFNALDNDGRDAAAHEVLDNCDGHPQSQGVYHHHMLSRCMNNGSASGTSPQIGIALDGFGIYGPYENGQYLSNDDLDLCHGRVSTVQWNGAQTTIYHYVANYEYPYTVGCFRGTPSIGLVSNASQIVIPDNGWWWNASEGGRGYSFEFTTSGHVFMAAYMYRSDGTPVWYSGTATSASNNTYTFTLNEYTGTETLTSSASGNTSSVASTPASVSVAFTGQSSGTITWSGSAFGSSTKTTSIVRYPFAGSQVIAPSLTSNPQTGWWWNSNESGTGYFIEQQGSQIFMAAYLYGSDQRDVWYYAQGTAAAAGSGLTMSATLYEAGNGQTLTSAPNSNLEHFRRYGQPELQLQYELHPHFAA